MITVLLEKFEYLGNGTTFFETVCAKILNTIPLQHMPNCLGSADRYLGIFLEVDPKGRGRIRTGIGPRTDSRKKFIL